MTRHPSALAGAMLLGSLAAGPVRSQTPPEVPGARAEVVQLDAVVTDARGALVRDLAQDDFQVLEDGQPQRITQFFVATRTRPAVAAPPSPSDPGVVVQAPAPSVSGTAEASTPGRHIVLLVDDLHIGLQSMVEAKRALHRFIGEEASPEDAIALLTTSGAGGIQQLTRDRAVLGQALERLVTREPSTATNRSAHLTAEQAALVLRGDRTALQLAVETVITEPGSLIDPNSPQVAVEGPAGQGGASGQGAASAAAAAIGGSRDAVEKVAQREVERQAVQLLNEALRYSVATLNVLEDVVRSVAGVPGRKLCLVVSDGFLDGSGTRESRSLDLRRVLDAATRSGTVVYALDSRGLVTGVDASASPSGATQGLPARVERQIEQIKRDALTTLTDGTGGFYVRGTNDPLAGLRRMLDDNEAYYLLAYTPTNARRDGRFRKIEVRLARRPDLKVRTRFGYYAPDAKKEGTAARATAPAPAGMDPSAAVAEARALLSAPIDAGGIPVTLRADFASVPPAGSQVLVRARVDLTGMRWQEAEGRHRADLELVGGVFDAGGQPIGAPFGRRAELSLASSDFERGRSAGFPYQQWVALAPGHYEVRLVARERLLAQQGGASQPVDVPDLADRKLAMSGLFLSTSQPGGATVADATAHRFKRGENVYFQFYVYNASLDAGGKGDVVLQAQVWSGGKAIAASPAQPARLEAKDGRPVPETNMVGLEGLSPGPYELRVVVADRKAGTNIMRRVPFTID
jgi:VWFA-related protein